MVLEQGITGGNALNRTRGRAGDFYDITQNYILARQVEGCTPQTVDTYDKRLTRFFRFTAQHGCVDIRLLDRSHIENYFMHLKSLDRSPFYIHGNYRALRAFFNWCVAEEFIERSPLRNIKAPRLPRNVGKPFITEVERDKMLRLCLPYIFLGARDAAIVWLFWATGMRLNELTILKLADLDFTRERIKVFGKGQKERYVPFKREAQRAVRRYLSYRRDDLPELWLTEERTPLHRWGVNALMRRLIDRAELKGQVKDACHIFRRSWAWRNIKAGLSPEWVRIVGGWESLQMLEHYIKAMKSEEVLNANWR